MADVTTTITVSSLAYRAWLRTSYIATTKVSQDGNAMVAQNEFGPDQEDALVDFLPEASREVLKLFISRQGDVIGVPFESSATDITYRFAEGEPVLPQAIAIKSALTEDVKNAVFSFVTYLWYVHKNDSGFASYYLDKYTKASASIMNSIHRLHD